MAENLKGEPLYDIVRYANSRSAGAKVCGVRVSLRTVCFVRCMQHVLCCLRIEVHHGGDGVTL